MAAWACQPEAPLSTSPVAGQWDVEIRQPGRVVSGRVTATPAKAMDAAVGMRGYDRSGDHDWPFFTMVWSLPPPRVPHSPWGVGFYGAHAFFSSLGCALVVYKREDGRLDGRWSDWTRSTSFETAEYLEGLHEASSMVSPADALAQKKSGLGLYRIHGGTSVASRNPEKEYEGTLRIEPLPVRHFGTPSTICTSYVVLWWSFEAAEKAPNWSQRGIGCWHADWLIVGWGPLTTPVGLAHYTFGHGRALGKGVVALTNEPSGPFKHFTEEPGGASNVPIKTVLDSHKMFSAKRTKTFEEFEEEWVLPKVRTETQALGNVKGEQHA